MWMTSQSSSCGDLTVQRKCFSVCWDYTYTEVPTFLSGREQTPRNCTTKTLALKHVQQATIRKWREQKRPQSCPLVLLLAHRQVVITVPGSFHPHRASKGTRIVNYHFCRSFVSLNLNVSKGASSLIPASAVGSRDRSPVHSASSAAWRESQISDKSLWKGHHPFQRSCCCSSLGTAMRSCREEEQ